MAQGRLYRALIQAIRARIPDDNGYEAAAELIGKLIILSVVDLAEGKLKSFRAYRFLYEGLLGGAVRPWLPSAFAGASALPYVHPEHRKNLLRSNFGSGRCRQRLVHPRFCICARMGRQSPPGCQLICPQGGGRSFTNDAWLRNSGRAFCSMCCVDRLKR
jgi:hypothetical protein